MDKIEFTDRYQALGIPYPDPQTMCEGGCEGIGFVPIRKDNKDKIWKSLWEKSEKENPTDDGCHFVKCPYCSGTGKKHK